MPTSWAASTCLEVLSLQFYLKAAAPSDLTKETLRYFGTAVHTLENYIVFKEDVLCHRSLSTDSFNFLQHHFEWDRVTPSGSLR